MTKSYRPYNPKQGYLLPPSPSEWLPEGHLAHFVMDVVAQLDLSPIHRRCQATDQRGVARPAGGACDIGAFESPFTAVVAVPPPPPGPVVAPADTTPPNLTVSGIRKTIGRKAFNKGLKFKVGANEPIAAEVALLAMPRKVTIAKLLNLVLATRSLPRAGGTRTVTLHPSPKVKGKRKVKMQLRVVAFDAGGNRSAKTVSFTVK